MLKNSNSKSQPRLSRIFVVYAHYVIYVQQYSAHKILCKWLTVRNGKHLLTLQSTGYLFFSIILCNQLIGEHNRYAQRLSSMASTGS